MEKSYPRLNGITRIEKPNGRCSICNKLRPDREVIIEFTRFRCENSSYKVHAGCLLKVGRDFLVDAVTKPK